MAAVTEYNLVLQEEQPAVDPYLCQWSEFFFLALLAYAENEQLTPSVMIGKSQGESNILLQKTDLPDINYPTWNAPKRVKLGYPTAVVIAGPHKDGVFVPTLSKTLEYGRQLHVGFRAIDTLPSELTDVRKEYALALHAVIQQVRRKQEGYDQLYARLRDSLVSRVQSIERV